MYTITKKRKRKKKLYFLKGDNFKPPKTRFKRKVTFTGTQITPLKNKSIYNTNTIQTLRILTSIHKKNKYSDNIIHNFLHVHTISLAVTDLFRLP